MQTLLEDLRYGIRMLAKTPGVVVLIELPARAPRDARGSHGRTPIRI